MSLQQSVASPDLQKQLDLLKLYPEIAEAHFRPAMDQAATILEGAIQPNIPVLSGTALAAFGAKVSGKGLNIAAKVGWGTARSDRDAWYMNVVEYGAKPHEITGRDGGRMVFNGLDGSIVSVVRVDHPGFPARALMKTGLESSKAGIDGVMAAANEAVVRELAVP